MFRLHSICITLLFVVVWNSGSSGNEFPVRNYPTELLSSTLNEKALKQIKLFDLLAFPDETSRFYRVDLQPNSRNVIGPIGVLHKLDMGFRSGFTGPTIILFEHYRPSFLPAADPETAKLMTVRVEGLDKDSIAKETETINRFIGAEGASGLSEGLLEADPGRCALFRLEEEYVVKKTLVLVVFESDKNLAREDKRSIVSCINRGHYYHVGFSNAVNLPTDMFVGEMKRGQLAMNLNFSASIPPALLYDAQTVGLTRQELLVRYVEIMEAYYGR